jgi:hypothetical protein
MKFVLVITIGLGRSHLDLVGDCDGSVVSLHDLRYHSWCQ